MTDSNQLIKSAKQELESITLDEQIQKAIDNFYAAFVNLAQTIFDAITGAFRMMYTNAGSPYGDTDEGFLRWLEELNEMANRSKDEKDC